MNKSQKLAIMRLRAKIKIEETMKQHQTAWYGTETKEIGVPKQEQELVVEEEDG